MLSNIIEVALHLIAAGSIAAAVLVISAVFVFVKRRRLGNAFRHRRMAENLVGGNPNYPGHMYLPSADQASFQLEEQSTNFVNPVYDTMFADADEDDLLDSLGNGPILRVPVSPLGENIGGKVEGDE